MILGQLVRVLRSRWLLILSITLVTLLTALVVSLAMAPRYTAKASLIVEVPSRDALGGAVYLPGSVAGFLATQAEVIKSKAVATKVVKRLQLDQRPENIEEFKALNRPDGDIVSWLADSVGTDLIIDAAREGAYVNLEYESRNPAWSADIVNAFAEAYVETVREMRSEPARRYAEMFQVQVKQQRAEVSAAQRKLTAYQQQAGIITTDERLDVENTRLQDLSSQLAAIQGALSESASRNRVAGKSGGDTADVVTNPVVQSLRGELSRAEARFKDAATRLGANHPQLVSAQAELEELRAQLSAEVTRVKRSLGATEETNQQRLAEVRTQLERQRETVMKMKMQRDQVSILQRDVENAQRTLDLLMERATRTGIEGSATVTNVSIVTPAVAPIEPSRPKPALNVAIGAILGLFLGVMAAVTLEGIQRPLRSADDLGDLLSVPMLGVVPHARSKKQQRLIGGGGLGGAPPLQIGR